MLTFSLLLLSLSLSPCLLAATDSASESAKATSNVSPSLDTAGEDQASMSQLSSYLSAFNSLEAAFTQRSKDERGEVIQTLTGRLIIQKPKQFYWQADEPAAQLLISDGESIWHYDEDLEQVIIQAYGAQKQQSPVLLMFEDAQYINKHFMLQGHEKTAETELFHLLPKQKDDANPIKAISLGFTGQQLKRLTFIDALQQATVIEFAQLELNKRFNPSQFHFDIPTDADVLRE